MKFHKTVFLFSSVLIALFCTSCSSSKSLEAGTYYLDWDNDVTFTISDIKNESATDGSYYQTCMIQFSKEKTERYIAQLQNYITETMIYKHALDGNAAGKPDLIDKNIAYYTEIYENSINLTKQFVDNPCKFYVYDIADEEYDTLYTHIDGTDDDYYFEITLDTDGSLIIMSNMTSFEDDIFRKK
ncbi:MAG: hypothetical protein ACI4M3_07510 [Acutalibacteraceae bacterium]